MNDIFLTHQAILSNATDARKVLEFLSENIMKIYNQINYEIVTTSNPDSRFYNRKFGQNWRAKYLTTGMLQQTVNTAVGNWRNYQRALQSFEKQQCSFHPFSGTQIARPRPPGYKHDPHNLDIIFVRTDFQCIGNTHLLLNLPAVTSNGLETDQILIPFTDIWGHQYLTRIRAIEQICQHIKQVRFKWNRYRQRWLLILVYEIEPGHLPPTNKNVMAIDLGLNNLCAITFRYGTKAFLVNGRPLKSFNRRANLRINQAQSIAMKNLQSSRQYIETAQIRAIRLGRQNYIQNYLHQAANLCVKLALAEKCKIIVTGDIKGIKYGKRNRSFVQIPLLRFANLIKYKAQLHGLTFVEINEAYTSQTSAIDLERIGYNANGKQRRIYRGAFKTNTGLIINSDINGSLNIMRRFLDQVYERRYQAVKAGRYADLSGSSPELIEFIRDKGFVVNPVKLQVILTNKISCE